MIDTINQPKYQTSEFISYVLKLAEDITINVMGIKINKRIERDYIDVENGRVFIQLFYDAPCTLTGR